jgi:hypothetical protein
MDGMEKYISFYLRIAQEPSWS